MKNLSFIESKWLRNRFKRKKNTNIENDKKSTQKKKMDENKLNLEFNSAINFNFWQPYVKPNEKNL